MTIIIISQLFMKLSFFRKKILIYKNIYSSKYNQKKKFRVLKVPKYYEVSNLNFTNPKIKFRSIS